MRKVILSLLFFANTAYADKNFIQIDRQTYVSKKCLCGNHTLFGSYKGRNRVMFIMGVSCDFFSHIYRNGVLPDQNFFFAYPSTECYRFLIHSPGKLKIELDKKFN